MRSIGRKWPFNQCQLRLLFALWLTGMAVMFNTWLSIQNIFFDFRHPVSIGSPFFQILLTYLMFFLSVSIPGTFVGVWVQMNASQKRIRQLEEKVEKLLGEKTERENAPVQTSNAPDDRYFSPR